MVIEGTSTAFLHMNNVISSASFPCLPDWKFLDVMQDLKSEQTAFDEAQWKLRQSEHEMAVQVGACHTPYGPPQSALAAYDIVMFVSST